MSQLSIFAANLSLILSILWCLSNAAVFILPCIYAAAVLRSRGKQVHSSLEISVCMLCS